MRNPHLWSAERNLAKIEEAGEPLMGRFQNQDRQFTALKQAFDDTIPSTTMGREEAGETISESLLTRWKDMQKGINAEYKRIDEALGGEKSIDLKDFFDVVDQETDVLASNTPGSVMARLKRLGIVEDGQFTGEPITVRQAEELRKFIGGLPDNGSDMKVKMTLMNKLDDIVGETVGDEGYNAARAMARERFSEFDQKLMKGIKEGKVDEWDVVKRAAGASPKQLRALRDSLTSEYGGKVYGADAWENLRQQVLEDLWEKGSRTGKFQGKQFQNALKKFGDEKLQVLFPGDEAKQLYRIAEAGIDLTFDPPYSAVNYSGTTPALMNLFKRMGAAPIIGDMLGGTAKKLEQQGIIKEALLGRPVGRPQRPLNQSMSGILGTAAGASVPGLMQWGE
jgi:hypothetical protein